MPSKKHSKYIERITPEERNKEIEKLKRLSNLSIKCAQELMISAYAIVPKAAKEYLEYISASNGINSEIMLTAYAHYYQAVQNMSCSDELYKITPEIKQWFLDHGHIVELSCMVCDNKWMGGMPERCCDGYQCGCMGQPIEPVVCSEECYNKLFK